MLLAGSALMYSMVLLITIVTVGTCAGATASLQSIRYQAVNGHTRVFIELDSETKYESGRIADPDRIFFDISNSKLSDDFQSNFIPVRDALLKRVRVAENRPGVVRVVLNISGTADYRTSELSSPRSIVVDLFSLSGAKAGPNPLPARSSPRPAAVRSTAASESSSAIDRTPTESKVTLVLAKANVSGETAHPMEPMALSSPAAAAEEAPSPEEETELLSPASATDNLVIRQGGIGPAANPTKGNLEKVENSSEQEKLPLKVDGILSTGYYRSFTQGGGNGDQRTSFVPAGAALNINGYYLNPDTLAYTVRTELNAGAQASDAGIEGGNGVRMTATAFRHGILPTTFRYSNVQLKDAYFGSLTQVSSYTQKNRNKDLGFTVGLRSAGLPTATVDWGTSSVRSQSYNWVLPDYVSQSSHLNLNCSDQRWGWDFQCFAERQHQTSDLYNPLSEGANSSVLRQRVTQYRASARRSFLSDFDLHVEGGNQYTANVILDRPIDLTTRYASVNLRMFQKRRWKTSIRAGYTSNIAGLVLTQLVGGLSGNGSIAPDASVLQPLQRTTSYFNLDGLTSVDLSHGFSLYGSMDRTALLTASDRDLSSRYLTTAGGITFAHSYRWGSLSGQYGRSFGIGSITGQAGRIVGQNFALTAQPGKPDGLLFDFSMRGSNQTVRHDMVSVDRSISSDMGVGFPVWDRLRIRFGGGWQRSAFENQGNQFQSKGYTAQIGIEHPRFQLNGSLNSNVGNSFQTYSQLVSGIGVESTFLTPLRLVPSDLRGITLGMRVLPMRKLELTALFTRSIQHLEGVVANDFEVVDVYATFRFRLLQIAAGFFNSTQIYSSYLATYPETQRGRFYVRISRPVKFW
jgi:hypothetical protein